MRHGRYTAGTATHYRSSLLTGASDRTSILPKALVIGTRFHSAPVIRLGGRQACPSRPCRAGRWPLPHLRVFAGAERSRRRGIGDPRAV